MNQNARIKAARRRLKCSQAALAEAIGVQRSAVSQWEAVGGSNPTLNNLRKIAKLTSVQFEWLATGRGPMSVSRDMVLDDVAAADALLVEDPIEMRLIEAIRAVPVASRLSLIELAEQLASGRRARQFAHG